jgi:hypothetical protein
VAGPVTPPPLSRDTRVVPIVIIGALIVLAGMGLWVWTLARELSDRDADVRAACEQYAAPLDLSGMAVLCFDAGYQQTTRFAPEDLERPPG